MSYPAPIREVIKYLCFAVWLYVNGGNYMIFKYNWGLNEFSLVVVWGLNELIHIKYSEKCLACGKY